MLKPQGYGVITDPDAPGVIEHDTITCSHCGKVVIIPPGWRPDTMPNKCKGCMGYLCLGCWTLRCRGADCVTWEKQMGQIEARDRALRSYGL